MKVSAFKEIVIHSGENSNKVGDTLRLLRRGVGEILEKEIRDSYPTHPKISLRQAKERDSFLYEAQRQRSREIYNRIIDEWDNITIEDILEEFPEDHDRLKIYGYGPRSEEYFQYLLDTYYYPYHSKKPITYDYGYDR